jgi:hypothetical protein
MIFSKGDVNSVSMIRNVLTEFQDLSGLFPNPNKSDLEWSVRCRERSDCSYSWV